jgi:hypothetical protein
MQETNDIRYQVRTFDGKEHEVAAHKSGKSWKASALIDGQHIDGGAARTPEKAIEDWKRAYKYNFDF